jgi:aspartate ammonia-lyase
MNARLTLSILVLATSSAIASPAPLDTSLQGAIRRTVSAVAKSSRGQTPLEIRGRVQQTLLHQIKAYRTREEFKAMKAAGLNVPYRDVHAFVEREFEAFVQKLDRPYGWTDMSPSRQFGFIVTSLKSSFAAQRTFPSNWQSLDPAARYNVVRCFAGNCSLSTATGELGKWLQLTGTPAPQSARPLTAVEKMLSTTAGGSQAAPKRYYGPDSETAKAQKNFVITGQRVPMDMIKSVAQVKAAAAITNMRTGRLDRRIGGAIIKAAREVIAGKLDDQFYTDPIQGGAGTSVNMNVNEVIAARASEILTGRIGDSKVVHPNDHVNMAQSTNDVYPTAARLTAYRRLVSLLASYELLVSELSAKAKLYAKLPKAGRTHLEDAVPIMLGREFQAYATMLKRDISAIKVAMKGLTSVNLGGTAVGTTLNAEPAYVKNVARTLARISGVPVVRARDLVDATQNVDAMVRAHAALKVSATDLIKVCNDLRMMNSGPRAGLGEITLPEMQKGSSIMPGKVNPVIAEVVNQISYQVQGNDVVVNLVGQNGQFELNQMEPVMVHNVLSSIQIMDRGARTLAEKAIRGLKANDEACLRGAKQMLGLATALVPKLGYDRSAALAKTALRTGRPLLDVVVEAGDLSAAEAARLLDPARVARGGVLK